MTDKKDNKGQCPTDNERIPVTGKDDKDEKEGTNVFCDVREHGSTIFFYF